MDVYDHLDQTKLLTELVAATFDNPRDHWKPYALLFGGETHGGLLAKIPESAFDDEGRKDAVAVSLAELIIRKQASVIITVQEAWVAEADQPNNRVDSLTITVLAANHRMGSIAPIKREPDQTPRLGEWTDSETVLRGRFIDLLVAALRAVEGQEGD